MDLAQALKNLESIDIDIACSGLALIEQEAKSLWGQIEAEQQFPKEHGVRDTSPIDRLDSLLRKAQLARLIRRNNELSRQNEELRRALDSQPI